ncbi:MAG: hypothetical protein AUJ11_01190 [Parcubacteria group bacterium CG1_02_44_65]|nr:MAG: hypothetical protein AUJ11_01190 [Parcubacteria group bacterium CG1_02_44_65]
MFIKTKKFINYNGGLRQKVKKLRQDMTLAEKKLWYEFLRGYRYRFVRQKAIGNYILDFYCQKLKLGIEIDGETHLDTKSQKRDETRTEELNKFGVEILRFWNDDILEGLGEVENIIENKVKEKENPL